MSAPTVLVTGDIVLDCQLYGGVKTAATSFSDPGTEYRSALGGAALMSDLLTSAADVEGLAYAAIETQWNADNQKRAKDGEAPLPKPKSLGAPRPKPAYAVRQDLDTSNLSGSLPPGLRSYGVWTDKPLKKGNTKERVWRTDTPFGYGSTEPTRQAGVFMRAANPPSEVVPLVVIDEGGILFRQALSNSVWPPLPNEGGGWVLLKMSWPLCRGDLWAAVEAVKDRLIVVVSAGDIRREDVQINPRLSWEQCVEHTIEALRRDPVAGDLLRAAHVIITYESEGALWYERGDGPDHSAWQLIYSPDSLEGDYAHRFDGSTFGFQTCFAAAIAHRLMVSLTSQTSPGAHGLFGDVLSMRKAIGEGIAAGLSTKRLLLELGHGPVGGKQAPGVPVIPLSRCVADAPKKEGGFVQVVVPASALGPSGCQWTILEQSERADDGLTVPVSPLTGLAQLTALHGPSALSHLPAISMGPLFTVDRTEIESLRMLEALIRRYEDGGVQSKPLSIGVFGPPGAGKSFGVKALAKAVLGDKTPFLEFNLSQFKSPDELIGAFHRVRDAVLSGTTPVAFWDEFDSQQYRWLQYLLAPMQDGSFQEGQVTHPIGKCVFIFAGGTAPSVEAFGVSAPAPLDEQALAGLDASDRAERRLVLRDQRERHREFVLLKGPDFVSRLHGFLNVLGPNPRTGPGCVDITWPVRRALLLRGILRLRDKDPLDIDRGLLNAVLGVSVYRHGARSFEKIVNALNQGREFGRLNRSALPPIPLLGRETDADAFHTLLTSADAFKKRPDLEALAAAVHARFLEAAEQSRLAAAKAANPGKAWEIHPSVMKVYEDLDADKKASNRAAARRIPDHLALIGYVLEPRREGDTDDWRASLKEAIERHVERLARAEHLGWCAERRANGWTRANVRNDALKHHHLLVDWADLSQADRDKDRSSARAIPDLLVVAGFKAVPAKPAA